MKKKTIFLTITHGWQIRLIFHTSFIDYFSKIIDAKIVIFSPNGHEIDFIQKYKKYGQIEKTQKQGGRFWGIFDRIRKFLVTGKMSDTKQIQLMKYKNRRPFYYYIVKIINWFFRYSRFSRSIYESFEKIFFRDKYFKKYFKKYDPDAVIIISTVHNEANFMLQRAQIQNVKVIQIVESWDHTSTKLNQVKHPDYFLVWNHIMANELVEFLKIKKDNIYVTGTSYHDIYAHSDTFISRKLIAKKYNMDPNKKWIIIAATLTNLYPDFDLFLKDFHDMKLKGMIKEDFQILIRPHPQAISGYSLGHGEFDLLKIKKKYNYIYYDLPEVISSEMPVYVKEEDIKSFAEILHHADVVISFFSTATIDACISNTPVILPAFNHQMDDFIYPTLAERVLFTHHSKLISTKGVHVSKNMTGLIKQINLYLKNPNLDNDRRKELVDLESGTIDGRNHVRMGSALKEIIEKISSIPQ